jgi:D-alanyl-lipoteichoic acid acyltransferase DltB (MBOAT superfamily)
MTSFFSVFYLAIFLPVMVILYNVCPKKYRPMVLIAGSYFYFYSISGKLLVYLLFSTMSIHHIGLWLTDIQKERDDILKEAVKEEKKAIKADYLKKQRRVLLFGVMLHLGILLIVKYTPFFATNINTLFNAMGLDITLTIPKIMMPIGISFYTLSAISYIFDVYRETIKADKNILRLALFMSFFPHIMEGPICRYSDTAHNLYKGERTNYQCLTLGLQRILFAMVKKMVVADRLNDFIQEVFTNYSQYDGGVILVGAVCYTIQLYMEFSGTMDIVIGTAQIFNVRLPENFKQPFFSRTISDFWSRWHITLGTFFKDYIFYPLTMSKPLKKLTTKARNDLEIT